MAKVAQLSKNGVDIYPKTLDTAIGITGQRKLLSTKLGEVDSTFSGITDGSIIVGKADKSYDSTYSGLATKATYAVNDADGNDISETYLKSADFNTITNSEIDSLFP